MVRRVVIGLLLVPLLAAPALADPYARKRAVDERIARLHGAIARAQERESSLAAEIETVTGRIRALEGRVGDVSTRLAALELDLALHKRRLDRLTELLGLQTRRLRFLSREYGTAVERLNRRLVEIYESEPPTTLGVIVSATSFSDLLEQLDYVKEIGSQDRRIASAVGDAKERVREARARTRRTRARVASATRVIAIRTQQARALRDRLLASERSLRRARGAKRETLADVRAAADAHRGQAEALSEVSAALGAQIRAAQAASANRAASSVSYSASTGAESASGFVWPVSGPVVSAFGMRWGRMHEGIDIGAPAGTPVAAAASGTVISAGWMGGYGNLVVIDHGGGVATAYAHLSAITVSGGSVAQGQTIGYVGCTGHCFGDHLHFEVRVNGAAVDPLGYLG